MIPTLHAETILLAPFAMVDAPLVQQFLQNPNIAAVVRNVPHPYPDGAAEKWIASHTLDFLEQRNVVFSIRSKRNELMGAINLRLNLKDKVGTMGYWIGVPFWNNGYCTAAATRLIQYGFEEFPLNKIHAEHLAINPASGRVMEKSGMTREGILRHHAIQNDLPRDVMVYGILRSEFPCRSGTEQPTNR